MKKHVTHIKKIEYTPSDGFRFIRRSTHEFLKSQSRVSIEDITTNFIVESDFVGERFICTDDEEVRDFLEFYERQKEGVEMHVFLKREFKDFIEIPKDEYEHELLLFTNAMLSNKARMMLNQPITNNKTVGKIASKHQNEKSSINEDIDKVFEEAHKNLVAMIHKLDKSYDKLNGMWSNSEIIRWW